jgi:hypothetical protein
MKNKIASLSLLGFVVFVNVLGITNAAGASQPESCAAVPVGFHEFEMFGEKSIYLSHYPMFGSIHAYQVLMEVELKSTAAEDPKQLYLAHKKKNPNARYSVSPENSSEEPDYWVLPEVIQAGKSFRANIHWQNNKDHTVYLARNVTVQISRVIYFRLFQPGDKKPDQLTYLLFGNDSETYMAHYIASYPDFDQILAVTVSPGNVTSEGGTPINIAIVGRDDNKSRRLLEKDKTIVGRVDGTKNEVSIERVNELHYEASLEIQR